MAVNGDAEAQALDRDRLWQKLITSSTKRRIHELSGLQQQVADDCECLDAPMHPSARTHVYACVCACIRPAID